MKFDAEGNKRGDITTGWLISIILIVAGFIILLLIYSQLNWQGSVDREACHTSIIARGTLPSLGKNYVPLKCGTAKICITGKSIGKGDCEEFVNEKSVSAIRVRNSPDGLEQIEKIYAREMLDCWTMTGEGKLSLFSQVIANSGFGQVYPSCIICSRIAVDKKSLDKVDFSKMSVYNYMADHKILGRNETYLQYMSKDLEYSRAVVSNEISIPNLQISDENGKSVQNILTKNSLEVVSDINQVSSDSDGVKESAVLFMQINAPKYGNVLENDLKGAVTFIAGGSLIPKFVSTIGRVALTKAGLVVLASAAVVRAGTVSYNRAVATSYCGDVMLGSEAKNGCSVVSLVDYNAENIASYCDMIESIP